MRKAFAAVGWIIIDLVVETAKAALAGAADERARAWAKARQTTAIKGDEGGRDA